MEPDTSNTIIKQEKLIGYVVNSNNIKVRDLTEDDH